MKKVIIVLFSAVLFIHPVLGNNISLHDSSKVNASIERAINYLNQRIRNQQLYFYILPILKPIAIYYQLPIDSSIYNANYYDSSEKQLIDLLSPLYKKRTLSKTDKKIIDNLSLIDRLIMFGLYGNKLYSKNYFKTYMDSLITWGQYDLTHAYFIALLLKNKKYISKTSINSYIKKIQPLMIKLLPKENEHYGDIDIEVIALLLYSNYNLDEEHILNLINQQTSQGSWQDKPEQSNPLFDDHTTVLGLWALLEWKFSIDTMLYLAHPTFIELNSK